MAVKIKNDKKIRQMTFLGMMTAMVFVLQFLAIYTRPLFPFFSITLVLVPIVLGAVVAGKGGGAWLGAVFGAAVFVTGDANAFFAIHQIGTIVTVMAKGMLCGLCAALFYGFFEKKSKNLGVFAASVACPVVNTGVFLVGCLLFFYDAIGQGAASAGSGWWNYFITAYVGINFLVELAINIVLAPIVVRLISAFKADRNTSAK